MVTETTDGTPDDERGAHGLTSPAMPELPDVTLYIEHLERRIVGATLVRAQVVSPNLLRSAEPPLEAAHGLVVRRVWRVGKRIVWTMDGGLSLVIHLMIAGRFHWKDASAKPPAKRMGKIGLATFEFSTGTLTLTEASSKKRASLHVLASEAGVRALDPGGIEVLDASLADFRAALTRESHTLKRALTDPHLLSGIGNAYSDEILHRAKLSPLRLARQLTDEEYARLHEAVKITLVEWTDRLRRETGPDFPEGVTAFREGMAVHGRYRQPCPVCGAPVQRIVYADNETNYCARCQTGGRLLADRSMSRLLRGDWPKTLEEMEG